MKQRWLLKLVQLAVLSAIIIIMSLTPLGYLQIGPLSIALVTIPVVIGAMVVGPSGGFILGAVFGITSFVQCFGKDPFGTALFEINPFFTFLMCVPTRILMGGFCGLIFKGLRKVDKSKTVCYFASGLCGALLNTIFFMSVLILCFWNTEYIQNIASGNGATTVLLFIVAMVGLNGIVEMIACAILGGGISKLLNLVIKKTSDGEYI